MYLLRCEGAFYNHLICLIFYEMIILYSERRKAMLRQFRTRGFSNRSSSKLAIGIVTPSSQYHAKTNWFSTAHIPECSIVFSYVRSQIEVLWGRTRLLWGDSLSRQTWRLEIFTASSPTSRRKREREFLLTSTVFTLRTTRRRWDYSNWAI